MLYRPSALLLLPLLLPLSLGGCYEETRYEITDVREPGTVKHAAPPKLDARQRLGMGASAVSGGAQAADTSGPLGGITFHHDLPPGWERMPLTSLRQANIRMREVPEAECYFTFLPGGGGGLVANLNRWRGQMGLDDLSEEAIAALPKKPIFGQPATFIQIDGDYVGMGTDPKPDYRMYGLVLTYTDPQTEEEQAFFLKMTGPRAVLADQLEAFERVASSLHAVAPGDDHTHDDDDYHDHDHGPGHVHDHDHEHGDDHDHDHGGDHDHSAHVGSADPHAGLTMPAASPYGATGSGSGYAWAIPEGWESLEPTMMRQANLTIAGEADVECYLTVLGGTGGGLDMNINRWRQQMGQPDLSAAEIAALPKHSLLGDEATYVVIDGTFGGMSGETQLEDFRMYGLVRVDEDQAFFVKMTGPQALLAAHEANFLAFSASLRAGSAPAPAAAHTLPPQAMVNPHGIPDPTPAGGFNPDGLTWTAPEGWQDGGERMMRVVTYETGSSECYVTSLAGEAGGVNANINRWVTQMGQPELDEAALAALPQIEVLGKTAPLIEVSGDFTGMSGDTQESFTLLGTVVPMDGQTIFVRMTGPEAEVGAEKENFLAFCASLKP